MSGYENYTLSPVPWIKQMPEHWGLVRGKNLYQKMQRPTSDTDEVVTCFRDGTVTLRKNRRTTGFTESLKEIGYQGIRKGDLVIHVMDAFAGSIGVSDSDGKGTPVYSVCQAKGNSNNQYYALLLREMARSGYIQSLYRGIRERSSDFRFEVFAAQFYPVPPREEQDQIVRFLDWKVSGINRLIGVRKKQVAEYEVLRKRIILSSVTHGLNKAAPVEMCEEQWIAEMPTHWSLLPIKRLFEIFSGATPQSGNSEYWNGDIVWITPADFKTKDHYIYQGTKNLTDSGFSACSTSMIPPDSIVFSKRAPVGTVAINKVDLCTNQGCLSCVPVEGVSSEFFYYAMSVCTEEFERRAAGTTFKEISLTAFGSFLMPVPPTDEQLEIVKYLEKTCGDIDLAIQNIQSQIEALNELKFRIIADTVTGKIDVRGIEIPEYEFVEEMVDDDNSDCGEEAEEQED